ncbi:MAG: hypothetical protein EA001_04030 [Oscillatoriales cyanobacterium]|nr:MAG: hypothetical protein EA001_04030 [Oscillatoriales cyanobacterium]
MSHLHWLSRSQLSSIATMALLAALPAAPALAQSIDPDSPSAIDHVDHANLSTTSELIDDLNQYGREGRGRRASSTDQVTSVSQLSDVQPTDWAFQALQSLVERYGCIAGYPDGTYKGNRAMTRYEFAAGLNACLDRIQELLITNVADYATKADLEVLKKLQDMFKTELAALRGRVDTLEGRISYLEKTQFSTTTTLTGNVIMGLQGGTLTGDDSDSNAENVTLSSRVRLIFNTSFTGKDALTTRLEANNVQNPLNDVTGLGSLSYGDGNSNQIGLTYLGYRFPIGEKLEALVGTTGLDLDDIHATNNPFLYGDGSGALSRFGDRPPVLRQPADAGLGLVWSPNDNWSIGAAYMAGNAADPGDGSGLFSGSYSASASLNYKSSDSRFGASLFFAHSYYSNDDYQYADEDLAILGGTGTSRTINPFGDNSAISNSVGLQAHYLFSPKFGINSWVGYTKAEDAQSNDSIDVLNWAVGFVFPDLGKEGNLASLLVGQPPTVISADGVEDDDETPIHVEALYRWAVNDFISVTPGVIAVFNADTGNDNNTAILGVVRTEFNF